MACQNVSAQDTFAEYQAMKPWLGWMHVKDYKIDPSLSWHGHVDEERLKNFVPVGMGDGGYDLVFRDLQQNLAEVDERMKKLGAPGVFHRTRTTRAWRRAIWWLLGTGWHGDQSALTPGRT